MLTLYFLIILNEYCLTIPIWNVMHYTVQTDSILLETITYANFYTARKGSTSMDCWWEKIPKIQIWAIGWPANLEDICLWDSSSCGIAARRNHIHTAWVRRLMTIWCLVRYGRKIVGFIYLVSYAIICAPVIQRSDRTGMVNAELQSWSANRIYTYYPRSNGRGFIAVETTLKMK